MTTCQICHRERTDADPDYNPYSAAFGGPIGWYSGDDGEICGDCMAELMGRANG